VTTATPSYKGHRYPVEIAGICVECLLTANDRETSASEGLADEKGQGQ
jgi:hypothetical protein